MREKTKVLVVDDEVPFTKLVKAQLERMGSYDVGIENDALRIIETATEFMPDLILLDIVMPGLDGGDVQALLRQHPTLKDIPVLIVSALVSNTDAASDAVVQSGRDTILAKPVTTERLISAIEQKLDGVI
jgi:CheY-like chemotaxis protein